MKHALFAALILTSAAATVAFAQDGTGHGPPKPLVIITQPPTTPAVPQPLTKLFQPTSTLASMIR
jgi:hypothetical protein